MSRTDRMQSDLERGFQALEEGQFEDAAKILERCKRIDRTHADVITLGAAVADAMGDTAEALVQYRALSALHPDDPMPRICVARLQLKDEGNPDAALKTLEPAFDFIDEEADLIEAISVKAEALITRGDVAAARTALAELATSVIDDPEMALELAELAILAEDPARALAWIETARTVVREEVEMPTDEKHAFEADALHAIGRVHEATGDRAKMIAAWQEVRVLDLAAPPGPLSITEEEIEEIALETLAELPPNIRALLEKVPILIDDAVAEDVVADGYDPRSLGLFQGTPMPLDQSVGGGLPQVTNIHLYKRSLERFATDEDHLAAEIRITLLHETAHYFGLDEDDLEAIGLD
jgi:predicted Zn-dependent protease with MMP-like domain/Flp pilus assembly protein TadD